jgi:hypothetical protein
VHADGSTTCECCETDCITTTTTSGGGVTTTTTSGGGVTTTTTSGGGGCGNCGCTTEKFYGTVCPTAGYDHNPPGLPVGASIIIAGCCNGAWTYPVEGNEFGVAIDLAKPNCTTYLAVEFTPDPGSANPLTFSDVSSTENGSPDVMISSCCGHDCNNPT